ncbi:BnaC02g39960D [Brassica napus]|uniref:BnaC02g39960D protein n=1 Tax=Brassica napus TaxID=3708 RepID=A0A078GIL5_BRANA|nr:BnaC02g39960D [Brassica napus]
MAMLTEIATLEEKYIELCKKHGTVPNTSILSAFFEAEDKKSRNQRCTMNLLVDRVMYDDFHPLLELCNEINASEVEGIDLSVRSSCSLEDQYILSLIRSVNQKLHLVDVHDCFGKTLWRFDCFFSWIAALLKLPSLEVLWFQIWICCSESSTGGGGGSSAAPRQRNTTSIKAAAAIGMQPVTVPISFRRREESQMNRGERQLAPEIGCEYSSPITLSKLHGRCKKSEVEELMYPKYRL